MVSCADICRKAGISQETYFNWKRYNGMLPPDMYRQKQLEDENLKLKTVADFILDKHILQDIPANV